MKERWLTGEGCYIHWLSRLFLPLFIIKILVVSEPPKQILQRIKVTHRLAQFWHTQNSLKIHNLVFHLLQEKGFERWGDGWFLNKPLFPSLLPPWQSVIRSKGKLMLLFEGRLAYNTTVYNLELHTDMEIIWCTLVYNKSFVCLIFIWIVCFMVV